MSRWTAGEDRGGPPEPGWYELRLVRKGPLVPARIVQNADGQWQAFIDGEARGIPHHDPVFARDVYRIWHGGVRSTEQSCAHLAALKRWAETSQPGHPLLHPLHPIDLDQLAPVVP